MFMGINGPRYATTAGLVALAKSSEGRNRGPTDQFYKDIDPGGVHVCAITMHHAPSEQRMMWLCKMNDRVEPIEIWIDCDTTLAKRESYTIEEFDKRYPMVVPASLLNKEASP